MSLADVFLLAVRWTHAIAAVTWVGGGLFYLLVLRPAQRRINPESTSAVSRAIAVEFQNLVDLCILALLTTGTILAITRLTTTSVGIPYFITLSIKISLALWMFWVVWGQRDRWRRGMVSPKPVSQRWQRLTAPFRGTNITVTLGLVVFLLADILRALVERSLEGG